jgi:hypothetical protein
MDTPRSRKRESEDNGGGDVASVAASVAASAASATDVDGDDAADVVVTSPAKRIRKPKAPASKSKAKGKGKDNNNNNNNNRDAFELASAPAFIDDTKEPVIGTATAAVEEEHNHPVESHSPLSTQHMVAVATIAADIVAPVVAVVPHPVAVVVGGDDASAQKQRRRGRKSKKEIAQEEQQRQVISFESHTHLLSLASVAALAPLMQIYLSRPGEYELEARIGIFQDQRFRGGVTKEFFSAMLILVNQMPGGWDKSEGDEKDAWNRTTDIIYQSGIRKTKHWDKKVEHLLRETYQRKERLVDIDFVHLLSPDVTTTTTTEILPDVRVSLKREVALSPNDPDVLQLSNKHVRRGNTQLRARKRLLRFPLSPRKLCCSAARAALKTKRERGNVKKRKQQPADSRITTIWWGLGGKRK